MKFHSDKMSIVLSKYYGVKEYKCTDLTVMTEINV